MDTKQVGATIAALRKQKGLTQVALAKKLNVSDKTVSKWESGQGFPEVTQFPTLAELFGVSVDYLMTGTRKGIAIVGNITCDIVKVIDCYPKMGMLSNITSVGRAVGGCVPNTIIDLAKIDHNIPLYAAGKVGDDEYGRYVTNQLQKHGINTEQIRVSSAASTSFTDVMSQTGGERTFFHLRGANAQLSPEDVDLSALNCSILHAGYILLLDKFDQADDEYGTVMARFLHDAQAKGIKTSVDVVSDSTADYKAKILPALKYCNYCIINEIECCAIWGLEPYKADGSLHIDNIRLAMERMKAAGVREKIVIHCKEMGFCLDVATDTFTTVPSLQLPAEKIKGSVGAGDAFCAGALYAIYNNWSDSDLLTFAAATAGYSLFADNSIDGMRSKDEVWKLAEQYGRK